ncbi:MAG: hypothetical protein ACPIOQ_57885, partial [Promethearchaeia archaeon]
LGIAEPAARITIGNSSAADLEGEEHGPEVRLHVGKGELEVSRDDLTILTQCTISMISALVASYSELCTLNALLWGGSGAGGHSPAARWAPASRGESSCGVGGSGMSGSSVALGDAGRQERVGGHVDAGPRLPQWAHSCYLLCPFPVHGHGAVTGARRAGHRATAGSLGVCVLGGFDCCDRLWGQDGASASTLSAGDILRCGFSGENRGEAGTYCRVAVSCGV